jgi:hypothetical protein
MHVLGDHSVADGVLLVESAESAPSMGSKTAATAPVHAVKSNFRCDVCMLHVPTVELLECVCVRWWLGRARAGADWHVRRRHVNGERHVASVQAGDKTFTVTCVPCAKRMYSLSSLHNHVSGKLHKSLTISG